MVKVAAGAILLATASCAVASSADIRTSSPANQVPDRTAGKVPDLRLESLDGDMFTLSDHVGSSVILMSFWATWCAPCLEELPHLEALYQQRKNDGLLVVAISMDEPSTMAQVVPTARRLGLTMPVLIDSQGRAARLYNHEKDAPKTVIINKQGQIAYQAKGYIPGDELKLAQKIHKLLQVP